MTPLKFDSGDVTELRSDKCFGFMRVSTVGDVYFRSSDYDGPPGYFDQLKGKRCKCAYVANFDPKKGGKKSLRALYVVEDVLGN